MNPNIEYHDKIVIGEDLFMIDPIKQRLQDSVNPDNIIPYQQMIDGKDEQTFIYNKRKICMAARSFIGQQDQGEYSMVRIPKDILYLKHACSLRENDKINLVSGMFESGFQMLGLRYVERMLGITPKVRIGLKEYYFKIKDNSLGLSLVTPEIYLNNFPKISTEKGDYVEALYNASSHQLVNMQPLRNTHYQGHYWVRIPEGKILDPIGAAILEGKPGYIYINQIPVQTLRLATALDRGATTFIALAAEDEQLRTLKAKQKFISELKARQTNKEPKPTTHNEIWLPGAIAQQENRSIIHKKLNL